MSNIRLELSHNVHGLDVVPRYPTNFDATLLEAIVTKVGVLFEFGSSNDCVFDKITHKMLGFAGTHKTDFVTPPTVQIDPTKHYQECLCAIGRYTQNGQFDVKDPLWKTRNEVAYRCFMRNCEFTFDLLFTPSGKSASIVIFETFTPWYTINVFGDAYDKRGLTKEADEIANRIKQLTLLADTKV